MLLLCFCLSWNIEQHISAHGVTISRNIMREQLQAKGECVRIEHKLRLQYSQILSEGRFAVEITTSDLWCQAAKIGKSATTFQSWKLRAYIANFKVFMSFSDEQFGKVCRD